jgi:WD40 repeat protein
MSVAYSPDGQRIASGADDGTVKIWNAETGALISALSGHIDSVVSVAFSPDGRRLVSGSFDTTVKIWAVGD